MDSSFYRGEGGVYFFAARAARDGAERDLRIVAGV